MCCLSFLARCARRHLCQCLFPRCRALFTDSYPTVPRPVNTLCDSFPALETLVLLPYPHQTSQTPMILPHMNPVNMTIKHLACAFWPAATGDLSGLHNVSSLMLRIPFDGIPDEVIWPSKLNTLVLVIETRVWWGRSARRSCSGWDCLNLPCVQRCFIITDHIWDRAYCQTPLPGIQEISIFGTF